MCGREIIRSAHDLECADNLAGKTGSHQIGADGNSGRGQHDGSIREDDARVGQPDTAGGRERNRTLELNGAAQGKRIETTLIQSIGGHITQPRRGRAGGGKHRLADGGFTRRVGWKHRTRLRDDQCRIERRDRHSVSGIQI